MMKVTVAVMQMPEKGKSTTPCKIPLEDRVRDMIQCIETSDKESYTKFLTLRNLAKALKGRKEERARNILNMIEPILHKYGYYP